MFSMCIYCLMFVYMCINSQYSSYPQVSTLAPCIGFGLLVHRPVGLQNDKNDKKFVETTIKPVYFRVYSPCKLHQIWVNHVFFNTKPEFIHLCDENVHPSPDPPGMDPRFAQVLQASAPVTPSQSSIMGSMGSVCPVIIAKTASLKR